MVRPLAELKNAHRGGDLWLLASGASMNYVDPEFFSGKVTMGINNVYSRYDTTYLLVHNCAFYAAVYRAAAVTRSKLLTVADGFVTPTERAPMVAPKDAPPAEYYVFECDYPPDQHGLDLDAVGTERLVAGMSTVHTALHACAYMGAANIIVCGADGGTLDGEKYYSGYRDGRSPGVDGTIEFVDWLAAVEAQTVALRDRLRAVYGCRVYSLNPFLNFHLEGHRYAHG